jgi:hypothetical protein
VDVVAIAVLAATVVALLVRDYVAPSIWMFFVAMAPPVWAAVLWRLSGADWLAMVSWSVPLSLLSIITTLAFTGPAATISGLVVIAVAAAFVFSSSWSAWWVRNVLRRELDSRFPFEGSNAD